MAERQVGLIRGINVGRAKRVAMADLRTLVEDLGYCDVSTLLNSGNVVFTDPHADAIRSASRIEEGLRVQLGTTARVLVLTAAELEVVVSENPLLEIADVPARLLVIFLYDPADRSRLEPFLDRDWSPERLALGSRAAYAWCPDGVLASALMEALGQRLGGAVTTRNWATVEKVHRRVAQGT